MLLILPDPLYMKFLGFNKESEWLEQKFHRALAGAASKLSAPLDMA